MIERLKNWFSTRPRIVTDADRAEAKKWHDEILAKYPNATPLYVGGSGTREEYLEEQAQEVARRRVKNEKLRFRRRRARERKKQRAL